MTDRQSCTDFVEAAVEKFGPVDVLVNLAALDNVFGGVQGADWDDWHKMFEVNVFGSLYMVEACLPHFRPEGAAVVFVGSQTMYDPPPTKLQAGYAASKSAMVGAMRHLTFELGRKGIRLNNVAPGWMWGPPVEGYVSYRAKKKGISEEEVLADLTKNMALRHDGDRRRRRRDGDIPRLRSCPRHHGSVVARERRRAHALRLSAPSVLRLGVAVNPGPRIEGRLPYHSIYFISLSNFLRTLTG